MWMPPTSLRPSSKACVIAVRATETFGSLKKLRAATAEEIATVPGVGAATAAAVVAALAADAPAPAVDVATGELVD